MYCQCGCGEVTRISTITRSNRGWVKGQHLRFIAGHSKPPRKKPIAIRYLIDPVTGCWNWLLNKTRDGYGVMGINGKTVYAHRAYCSQPIPEGYEVDHLCNNVGCVNPDHLEPVTRSENLRRAYQRGRETSGACKRKCPVSVENVPV